MCMCVCVRMRTCVCVKVNPQSRKKRNILEIFYYIIIHKKCPILVYEQISDPILRCLQSLVCLFLH